MQLGFVSAILPELTLEEVLIHAAQIGYDCVEVMCWPKGKAARRYAGVTHIDLDELDKKQIKKIHRLVKKTGVQISALGYYPNPLTADTHAAELYIKHIKKMIKAAKTLGFEAVNTFIGKDHTKTVEDNWDRFKEVWIPIIALAEQQQIKVGIENCPMFFTNDEWPGGNNLATSPAIWKKMYEAIPSDSFGLNYDPSHMVLQHMDYLVPMQHFSDKLFHIHAKDLKIDQHRLNEVGIFAPPNQWHTPKLPGLGDIQWGSFFSTLTDTGYDGAVCVEVEDRAFEGTLDKRLASLRQSHSYLRQFIA